MNTRLQRRTPLRAVSKKRAQQNRLYSKKRKAFLIRFPVCQIWTELVHKGDLDMARQIFGNNYHSQPDSTEIHHKRKPRATYLNDETTWLALSRQAHNWVEAHKSEARARGWLL